MEFPDYGLTASGIMLESRDAADAAGKKAGKTKVRNTDQKAVLPCPKSRHTAFFVFKLRKAKKQ